MSQCIDKNFDMKREFGNVKRKSKSLIFQVSDLVSLFTWGILLTNFVSVPTT